MDTSSGFGDTSNVFIGMASSLHRISEACIRLRQGDWTSVLRPRRNIAPRHRWRSIQRFQQSRWLHHQVHVLNPNINWIFHVNLRLFERWCIQIDEFYIQGFSAGSQREKTVEEKQILLGRLHGLHQRRYGGHHWRSSDEPFRGGQAGQSVEPPESQQWQPEGVRGGYWRRLPQLLVGGRDHHPLRHSISFETVAAGPVDALHGLQYLHRQSDTRCQDSEDGLLAAVCGQFQDHGQRLLVGDNQPRRGESSATWYLRG